jgi:putative methionine-R-sulfoxide reductase with GAF domain
VLDSGAIESDTRKQVARSFMGTDESSISETGTPLSSARSSVPASGAGLAEMGGDLQAALQLLANRACYITGATTSIIAIGEGDTLLCKAASGKNAPAAGSQIQIDGGLTSELMAECVTTRQPVRCDDVEKDGRVRADQSAKHNVGSALVAPLIHENEVVGIFQLESERKSAFEERDVLSLSRLAAAVQTALEEALVKVEGETKDADRTALDASAPPASAAPGRFSTMALRSGRIPLPQARVSQSLNEGARRLSRGQDLRRCKGCGFPVSADRTLCVDCEVAEIAHGRFIEQSPTLYPFTSETKRRNWLDEHFYTIGIVLVSILTVIVLFLWAR